MPKAMAGIVESAPPGARRSDARSRREERYLLQRNALIALTQSEALNGENLAAGYQRITETAAVTLGVDRVSIWLYNADRTAIVCHDLYQQSVRDHSSGIELAASAFPAYFRALSEMTVLSAVDARRDPATREFTDSYLVPLGITAMLDAPIRIGGAVAGVLCHEHVGETPRDWSADESAFAVAVSNLVSTALGAWQQRRADALLRDSESRHRALFEQSADANLLVDEHGIADCNPAALQMFGYASKEELVGQAVLSISPATQPDGTSSRAAATRHMASTLAAGQHRFEWTHRRKTGELFPTDVCLTGLTLGGRRMLLGTVRDISERQRAEAQLRLQSAALNAAASAVVITDRQGTIVWSNRAFTQLTGYEAGEAMGKNPGEILKSGVQDRAFYRELWSTIRAGRVWHGELINRRKDGQRYPEEQTITPVTDVHGEITHFVGIKRDLTAQRQMEAQLLYSQKMEAIATLTRGIAHDFNNILGAMLGCAELAVMDADGNDAVLENLTQVLAAGQRAAELVRQLQAFSGQQEHRRRPIRLEPVVGEALSLLRASLPASVGLRGSLGTSTAPVLADPTEVHQIVMNLVINAWHAIGDREGTVDVRVDMSAAPADAPAAPPSVRLTVSDTGHGMDAATAARIFEPFFTTKQPGKGTGLGLATVHGIMKKYGGDVSVTSEPGAGTSFELHFPVMDAGSPEAPNAPASPRGE